MKYTMYIGSNTVGGERVVLGEFAPWNLKEDACAMDESTVLRFSDGEFVDLIGEMIVAVYQKTKAEYLRIYHPWYLTEDVHQVMHALKLPIIVDAICADYKGSFYSVYCRDCCERAALVPILN